MENGYIDIQEAKEEDYNDLRAIFFNSRLETFNIDSDSIKIEDFDSSTEGEVILIAKIDSEIVGFISIWEEDKFIHNLFVKSSFKRCGVGKTLINSCVELIGLPLTLKCVTSNKNALNFYLSQGWTIEEEVKGTESYYLMKYIGGTKLKLEDKSVKNMWENYLNHIGESVDSTSKTYTAWHFCNDGKNANELAELVIRGTKRGTASLYKLYEIDNEEIPKEGTCSVIIDWYGVAKCVIENKNVYIIPFKDVDDKLAYIEGEGDKSLAYWRKVHIDYFKKELAQLNLEFNEDMLVVFEEFEVVYKD